MGKKWTSPREFTPVVEAGLNKTLERLGFERRSWREYVRHRDCGGLPGGQIDSVRYVVDDKSGVLGGFHDFTSIVVPEAVRLIEQAFPNGEVTPYCDSKEEHYDHHICHSVFGAIEDQHNEAQRAAEERYATRFFLLRWVSVPRPRGLEPWPRSLRDNAGWSGLGVDKGGRHYKLTLEQRAEDLDLNWRKRVEPWLEANSTIERILKTFEADGGDFFVHCGLLLCAGRREDCRARLQEEILRFVDRNEWRRLMQEDFANARSASPRDPRYSEQREADAIASFPGMTAWFPKKVLQFAAAHGLSLK